MLSKDETVDWKAILDHERNQETWPKIRKAPKYYVLQRLVTPNRFTNGGDRRSAAFRGMQQRAVVAYAEAQAVAAPSLAAEDDDAVADECVERVASRWCTAQPDGMVVLRQVVRTVTRRARRQARREDDTDEDDAAFGALVERFEQQEVVEVTTASAASGGGPAAFGGIPFQAFQSLDAGLLGNLLDVRRAELQVEVRRLDTDLRRVELEPERLRAETERLRAEADLVRVQRTRAPSPSPAAAEGEGPVDAAQARGGGRQRRRRRPAEETSGGEEEAPGRKRTRSTPTLADAVARPWCGRSSVSAAAWRGRPDADGAGDDGGTDLLGVCRAVAATAGRWVPAGVRTWQRAVAPATPQDTGGEDVVVVYAGAADVPALVRAFWTASGGSASTAHPPAGTAELPPELAPYGRDAVAAQYRRLRARVGAAVLPWADLGPAFAPRFGAYDPASDVVRRWEAHWGDGRPRPLRELRVLLGIADVHLAAAHNGALGHLMQALDGWDGGWMHRAPAKGQPIAYARAAAGHLRLSADLLLAVRALRPEALAAVVDRLRAP